ncbi:nucleoside-diphosphate kinase [Candidatus Entotheonella palauensis]|uniref:Nucleoside diphosphate kinase n=1 Tax=Candidatus Entotheonella gemina TaxID=1429439 RepID=W4MD47_9BACT|nr:nucleoside-diphosphate kinase [Candidatus Entotheonella palauensis]ETX08259.1 MAG: nucleoside diphosphate kinase [Candidatus Entotheonella gemina]
MEQTLTIIKPDAVGRHLAGNIIARLEAEGFELLGMKMVYMSKQDAERFYAVHRERPFFNDLTTFMSSGPCIPIAMQRDNAIDKLRQVMGATNPAEAAEGTIRKQYALDIEKNSIHGSDSPESAAIEIPFFFNGFEFRA